jgi:hypothetical protein
MRTLLKASAIVYVVNSLQSQLTAGYCCFVIMMVIMDTNKVGGSAPTPAGVQIALTGA